MIDVARYSANTAALGDGYSQISCFFVLRDTSALADAKRRSRMELEVEYWTIKHCIAPFRKDSSPILQIAQTTGQVIVAYEFVMLLIAPTVALAGQLIHRSSAARARPNT